MHDFGITHSALDEQVAMSAGHRFGSRGEPNLFMVPTFPHDALAEHPAGNARAAIAARIGPFVVGGCVDHDRCAVRIHQRMLAPADSSAGYRELDRAMALGIDNEV